MLEKDNRLSEEAININHEEVGTVAPTTGPAAFPGLSLLANVIFPNGNEVLKAGDRVTIQWETGSLDGSQIAAVDAQEVIENLPSRYRTATSISIIITTYNRERYLGSAIESVLAQTHRDFELLIWDDGSTDSSVDIARDYALRDSRVRVVAAPHRGRVKSLKAAFAETSGTYVGLLDSDDLLAPTALEETMATLEAHSEIGMVYTDYMDIDEKGEVSGYGQRCYIPYSREGLLLNFMTFHFRLIRRSVLEQVGDFDESFPCAQDYDLCLRLSEITEVWHLEKPLYYYRVHSQNISHEQSMEQARCSYKAIKAALKRRGLADFLELKLRIRKIGQIFL